MNLSETVTRLVLVAVIWAGWCVQHSFLNSGGLLRNASILNSWIGPYYRLVFNLITVATLVLAVWITPRAGESEFWAWKGGLSDVRVIICALAVGVFWLSFRNLDGWEFLGLRAFMRGSVRAAESDRLVTRGIYGVIRHPQFAAGLMLLWARDLTDTGLIINLVLSGYLIIGARIEEARLRAKWAVQYNQYCKAVPRFIPRRIPGLRELLA